MSAGLEGTVLAEEFCDLCGALLGPNSQPCEECDQHDPLLSPACPRCGSDDRKVRFDVDAGSYYAPLVIPCDDPWHDGPRVPNADVVLR